MELVNKDPTAGPVSLPLGLLRSITDDFCDERKLGEGSYGVVYKGILPCGSVIAVKKFNGRIPAVDDLSFENEASCLMGIKHHNIVQLLGFCVESRGATMMKQPNRKVFVAEERTIMLCFEYICNGGLDKHLSDESSGLDWNTRYEVIKGICSGLNYLHDHNIIHRDLKPQNILMDTAMVPKIVDFGLARLLGEQKSYTVTSNWAGTLGYMAPEYINKGEISKETDIFSLGDIIIEILKGCRDYPDYWQSTETDFQHFADKVLNNWRNRIMRASKYTTLELHTLQVKQCINLALKCVHPNRKERPNISNIIESLNATERNCCDQNGKDLPVDHQMGTQKGLPPSGVLRREERLLALNRIPMKNDAPVWIAKGMMKSAVAPHQPQREPVLNDYQGARNASIWVIKQGGQGFELRQIGHLEDLRGSLQINSLENVQLPEEADEAKLMLKSHLHELMLCWNNNWLNHDSALEKHVLERLKPSSNLKELSIIGHRGGSCPSWLGTNLSLSSLKSLCLDDVNWKTFPPIGDVWLVNVPREDISISIPEKRFANLRRLELRNLSGLKTWAVHAPCQLFASLEVLIIMGCSQLVELSISHSVCCCQQGRDGNEYLFSRLSMLKIQGCPELSLFPPIPWTEAPCSISIEGISSIDYLDCGEENEYSLNIVGKEDTNDSMFENVLAFHKLTGLQKLRMLHCGSLPLNDIQMLSSLTMLEMSCSSNTFPFVEADWHAKYQFPVESLVINEWNASGKELTRLLVYFPNLSDLELWGCENVTGLAVNVRGQHTTETPRPSSPASEVEQQQGARAEDDVIAASEEAERGLLLLPSQLQELEVHNCPKLTLLNSNSHDDSNEDGGTRGGGLQCLTSLRLLRIGECPKLLSAYASTSFSSSLPFPNSLEHLEIKDEVGMDKLALSNLTSLTSLSLYGCGDLRVEGFLSLLAQGHLKDLSIHAMPNFFVDSEPSWVHEQEIPSCSSKLQDLIIDDVAGFTAASIRHNLLLSSLTKLEISGDNKVERFMEEQEALLFVSSLEDITFFLCHNLQSLPERLHRLPNLKRLCICGSKAIQMLPKDGLPSSLQELDISSCPQIQALPKGCLPDSLQKLEIEDCPALRSLPEVDDLPNSLQEIDVRESKSEELRSQCRKLINIIPIVIA